MCSSPHSRLRSLPHLHHIIRKHERSLKKKTTTKKWEHIFPNIYFYMTTTTETKTRVQILLRLRAVHFHFITPLGGVRKLQTTRHSFWTISYETKPSPKVLLRWCCCCSSCCYCIQFKLDVFSYLFIFLLKIVGYVNFPIFIFWWEIWRTTSVFPIPDKRV